jgi:predicted transcriptional regulator
MPSAPINPTKFKFTSFNDVFRWAQSVYTTLVQGISLARGHSTDITGIFNTFDPTNGDGIMLRIGALSSSEHFSWSAGNQVTLTHNLQRQPTGVIVTDLDGNAVIFRVGKPTGTQITLQTTSNTVNATVYIF